MVVVNNMRANVDVLPYDDRDRAVKLLHSLDRTIWGGKFEAIVELEKYDTLTVNELFSKLKSAEVDRGMTAKLDGPTDSHSLALVGGSKRKANTNPSTSLKLIPLRLTLLFLMRLIVLIALFSLLILPCLRKSMPPSVRN
jgi:hypothetical protein